jgi:uncharacterized protein YjbJ (UPF0337 family)
LPDAVVQGTKKALRLIWQYCANIGINSTEVESGGCDVIDKDKAQGKAEQLKGKVKQAVGKTTGSKEIHMHGKVDEVKGQARVAVADAKSEAKKVVRKLEDKVAKA